MSRTVHLKIDRAERRSRRIRKTEPRQATTFLQVRAALLEG